MGTVRIVSRQRKDKNIISVIIRVSLRTGDRSEKVLFEIDKRYFNEKTKTVSTKYELSDHYNNLLISELNNTNIILQKYELTKKEFKAKDIFLPYQNRDKLKICTLNYSKLFSNRTKQKYINLARYIDLFDSEIMLSDIDIEFMSKFKSFLTDQPTLKSTNTVNKLIINLKTVLRYAKFNDPDVLKFRTSYTKGNKAKLTHAEFERLKAVAIPDLQLYKDLFCFQVYLRGSRIADILLLKPDNLKGERIIFNEQKTGKIQDIKLIPEALEILKRYYNKSNISSKSNIYLFPILEKTTLNIKSDLDFLKHIESKTTVINRNLKLLAAFAGIEKKITTHVARHTFASWADRSGLTSRQIQAMLNHSSLDVTESYLEGLRKSDELDDAADRVFN